MISKETIDRVFETALVEEVISDFIQLKKSGSNHHHSMVIERKNRNPFSHLNETKVIVDAMRPAVMPDGRFFTKKIKRTFKRC